MWYTLVVVLGTLAACAATAVTVVGATSAPGHMVTFASRRAFLRAFAFAFLKGVDVVAGFVVTGAKMGSTMLVPTAAPPPRPHHHAHHPHTQRAPIRAPSSFTPGTIPELPATPPASS
jgi:hypothetical protein